MNIILASGSPRRKELIEMLGITNPLIFPAVGEEVVREGLAPSEVVRELARQKAVEVRDIKGGENLIIAADTVVSIDGEILGKPKSKADAIAMVKKLSGKKHKVFTGICVTKDDVEICDFEETEVSFRVMTDMEIEKYVETGEPMDKAGAYGIQGKGALFVEGIVGDFYNVMGLPVCKLGTILEKLGVDII